jgi:hypothetical protein
MTAVLVLSSLHDFIERTIAVAPSEGFHLDLTVLYAIYTAYCKALETQPSSYPIFLDGCRRALPHSYREVVTGYAGIGSIATLAGVTYKQPAPWKLLKKGYKFYLDKSTATPINEINQALSNEEKPIGIPEHWPDFARLCKIRSGNKIIIFSPYDYQVKLWELVMHNPRLSIVKSRQLGITQLIISIFLHRAALNEAYVALVFMRAKKDTSKVADRNRAMIESMDGLIVADKDSNDVLKLKKGGYIYYMNAESEGGRSIDSVSDSLYDEAAFVPNIASLIGGTAASSSMVGEDATQIVVSTPNTKYGWFYNRMAKNNPDDFDFEAKCKAVVAQQEKPFYTWPDKNGGMKAIIHWRAHPIYSKREDFVAYRQKLDEVTEEQAEREYNLLFENSGVTIFSYKSIAASMIGKYEPKPEEGVDYYMGIDTAGIGSDFTVGTIGKEFKKILETDEGSIQLNCYSVVDTYRKSGEIHNVDLLNLIKMIRKWKPRRIGVECYEGTGEIMRQHLVMVFPDIEILSLKLNDASKVVVVGAVKIGLQEQRIIYPPSPLADELAVYSLIEGKMEAASGYNDDCVSSLIQMIAVTPFNEGDHRLVAQPYEDENEDEGNYGIVEAVD